MASGLMEFWALVDVDGGVVEVVGEHGRDDPLDLRLDGRHVATPVVQLEVREREVRAAIDQPPCQRRGEDHGDGTVGVDVVLDDGVVEDHRAHEGQVLVQGRLRRWAGPGGGRELGVGVGSPGSGLSDVETQLAGCTDGHDDLVGPVRIGHPTLHDGDPVLVEVEPAHAPLDVHVDVLGRLGRLPVGSERRAVEGGEALGTPHVRQARDGADQRGVVAVGVPERRV